MKKISVLSLLAIALIALSACGAAQEAGRSSVPASAQSAIQSAVQSSTDTPSPVKDYMDANFESEYDVITTDAHTDVRVYGLSKEDTEALSANLIGLAENISVSDYSDDSTILYTYLNGKLTYDSENPTELKTQGDGTVTMEIYQKIKNGMTYNEVVNLIGADGKPVVSIGDGEYKTESYEWPGSGGELSSVSVTFQGDVVSGKLQIGLE